MSQFLQPTILLLTEGTEVSQGKSQIISNINACSSIVELVRTTLGPRGMDKLIKTQRDTTITNDGATILNLLEIVHPAARLLVDIAKAQDNEVGDGTTTVALLTGEILKEAKGFIEDSMNPQSIIKGLREALTHALTKLEEIAVPVSDKDPKFAS